MTISLLLADDHTLVRKGLALLIREQRDWELVGEAEDGETAVRMAEATQPQIALLDVEMPGMNGIQAAREIKAVSPTTAVIALSSYGDIQYQEQMFAAGASAYVLKNEAMEDLVAAVAAVLRGERFLSPSAERSEPVADNRSILLDKESLSQRELEVLRLLAEGRRTKEIAKALGISDRTVETYRSRIMMKLRIRTLPGLVKFAIRAGLVEPSP